MDNTFTKCLRCEEDKLPCELLELKCQHIFCLTCLNDYIKQNLKIHVKCPQETCEVTLSDSEMRTVLPDDSIKEYEMLMLSRVGATHQCLLDECQYMVEYNNRNIQYDCHRCSLFNCILCKKAHKRMSCDSFAKLPKKRADKLCEKEMQRARNLLAKKQLDQPVVEKDPDLWVNDCVFECRLCEIITAKGRGVKLRKCQHLVCLECISKHIMTNQTSPIKCPNRYCKSFLEDREIVKILKDDEYEVYARRTLNFAIGSLVNPFQCQTADCYFLCELKNPNVKTMRCPKCKIINCIPCKAIHTGEKCTEYKLRTQENDKLLKDQIDKGSFMNCPACQTLIRKTGGCDWLQCIKCRTELCWVTKKRRWGLKGRGDISDGCKCMVNNIRCHPDCQGCMPH